MKIKKRDGRLVEFNKDNIINALFKAHDAVHPGESISKEYAKMIDSIIESVKKQLELGNVLNVETIQDQIENALMASDFKDIARAYIQYRHDRTMARENPADKEIMEMIDGDSEYWNTENSNKNAAVVTTQRDYMAGIMSKELTRKFLLPKDVLEAHDKGICHQHDIDYFIQPMHNCFHSKTRIVTKNGVFAFSQLRDGQRIQILNKSAKWEWATVKKYDKRQFQKVTLKSMRTIKEVICTSDHRWILKDGSVTTNLKIGDILYGLQQMKRKDLSDATMDELNAFAIGFALGDGTDRENLTTIRLCGNKCQYAWLFKKVGCSVTQPPHLNGDLSVNFPYKFKQDFINAKAWRFMSTEQKEFLFRGYFAADGYELRNKLGTSDERMCALIEELAPVAGYHIWSKTEDRRPTNYKEERLLYLYQFVEKQRFNQLWHVVKIENYQKGSLYDTWCVETDETHTFTLDGGIITGNCELCNLNDMLQNGTVINKVKIDKPHRLITATTIATQIILGVTSSSYGGCSITLTHLAPFVRDSFNWHKDKFISYGLSEEEANNLADKSTRQEIKDSMQTLIYQLNSMTNSNGQSPFISVFMYLNETQEYKEELALLIEEVLKQRIQGMKNEKGVYVSPAFPKLLYVLEEDNIKEDSKYYYLTELAAKCSAKRLVPDYISEKRMKEFKDGTCFPPMGCRSQLSVDEFTEKYGNIANALDYDGKPKYYGRNNIGVATLNLPYIALEAYGDKEKFWDLLNKYAEIAHKGLKVRVDRMKETKSDVAPILWQYGALARLKPGETLRKLVESMYMTVSLGYAGIYEAVKALGFENHYSGEGKEFGLEIMKFLNNKCDQWKQQDKAAYSLYGSPIESQTYRFAKANKRDFGIIKDITDHDYLTNSYHVNVRDNMSAFDKLKIESDFQKLSLGGNIEYVELPNLTKNIPAVLEVIKFIYDNCIYAELNTKSDYCSKCGFDGEIEIKGTPGHLYWECPNCGNTDQNTLTVVRRTCGYLGSNFWNQGRTEEIKDRVLHLDDN